MGNELQENEQKKELAVASNLDAWGGGQTVTANDIIIPKILPLQYMSEKLKKKQGEYGEFRDTINNHLFGDLKTPFEFIPFYMEKKWIEFDMVPQKAGASKREFKQIVKIQDNPMLPGYNDELPLSEPGIERDRIMDFYVLIPSEVKAGEALPYVLSFRRTSLKAGKKLAHQMFIRNRVAKKVPAATVMLLSGNSVQNDQGEFVVQDVSVSRAATPEELVAAKHWFDMVGKGAVKVDDSDLAEEGVRDVKPAVDEEDMKF